MLICAAAGSASPITIHSHAFESHLPVTTVNHELAQYGPVELTVHDVSGRLVRRLESGPRQRGIHAVRWDGTDGRGHAVPAGVYFVRFCAGQLVSTGRLTLVR
jgi:flagellar hook assembly protein FlgD